MKETNPNFDFYAFNEQPTPPAPAQEPVVTPAESVTSSPEAETIAAPAPAPLDVEQATAKMRQGYSRLGWAFVGMTLGWVVLTVILQVVATLFAPWMFDAFWFDMVAGTLPLYLICTPLLFLMVQGTTPATLERKKLSISHFLILLVLAEAVMVAGSLVGNGFMSVLSLVTGNDFENQLNEAFSIPIWLSFAFSVILAPIFEELIFRKLLLDRMLPHGAFCAVLVNGLLFGAFHGNFYQFFYAAMLGMLLAFVYAKTGKIHHCILLHMCVNFLGGIVPTLLNRWLGYEEMMALIGNEEALALYIESHILPYLATSAYSLAQYGIAIAGLILFIVNFKAFAIKRTENQLPVGKGIKASFLNPGIIAALVVCGILFSMALAG